MMLSISLINGLVFGIEHMQEEEDPEIAWLIAVHVAFLRLIFMRFKP